MSKTNEAKEENQNENLNNEEKTTRKSSKKWIAVIVFLLLVALLIFAINFFIKYEDVPSSYFSEKIKVDMRNAIDNGAQLDVAKHMYDRRKIEKKSILRSLFYGLDNSYPEPTPLSTILNDIKVDCYQKTPLDSVFIKRLNCIISEHNEINPFGKLDDNQRFLFENIRQKLNENYSPIQDDLNRIADEMNSKNLLVEKYLAKSNLSFWISIAAVGITFISSIIQILFNGTKNNNKQEEEEENDVAEDVKSESEDENFAAK